MTGKPKAINPERVKELLAMFNDSVSIARFFGMKLSFTEAGNAVVELPYNPNLNHGRAGIHGGVYATLLDSAGALTAAVSHDSSCWLATSEMSIHFLLPVERTALRAVGRMIKHGRRQDVVAMELYDEQGQLVGHATGTFVVIPKTSPA
jgi:uncharacterized protein (TIGR00369 family)